MSKTPDLETAAAFRDWQRAAGYNGKQVVAAGEALGMSRQAVLCRHRGTVSMSLLERMGLTAAFLGLGPWEPGFADVLDDDAKAMVKLAMREIARCIGQRGRKTSSTNA